MSGTTGAVSPETFLQFGELLHYLRERAELSQRELALQVGYHHSYMSRIEKNERIPDSATLMARFVPALGLEDQPQWTSRLLQLATSEGRNLPKQQEPPLRFSIESAPDSDPREIDPLPDSFPVSLTALLGREVEVSKILGILSQPDARLITLVGPPGIGKTRLAIEVARQAAGTFAHGMIFIDFAPVTDPEGFLAALSRELGVTESPGSPLITRLVQAFRHKNLLLVLDNFEQLTQAAQYVSQILTSSEEIRALVTSRVPLHIPGEKQFAVPPLALPRDGSTVPTDHDPLQYAAIQLFVERAGAVQPGFRLSSENTSAVLEICRRLDGLPLAIELAAARVKTLSPQAMLKQFDRRFDWLGQITREGQASKQSLRGAIEWSYNLLSAKEQLLFRRLSVFSFGRTAETAEAICSDEETSMGDRAVSIRSGEIFNLLIQLTDQSLLYTEIHNGETRFNFMETIHDFAREKLNQSGEERDARNRHLAWFCRMAERVDLEIEGADQLNWVDRCETEYSNMRAAMEWSLQDGADLQNGIRLAANLGLFWFIHSHFIEGLHWYKIFLPKARDIPDEKVLAKLLFRNADLHLQRREFHPAVKLIDESISLCRKIKDDTLLGAALYIRADLALALRELENAKSAIQECIALSQKADYPALEDVARILLGRIHFQMQDQESARASLLEGLALASKLPDYWGIASAHRVLGEIYMQEGHLGEARRHFELGLKPARNIGDKLMVGGMLANLAMITNLQREFTESDRHAEEAYGIFQAVGDELQQPLALRMMGYAAIHSGNLVRARVLIRESLKGDPEMQNISVKLAGVVGIAKCRIAEKNLKGAVSLCAMVEHRMREAGVSMMEPDVKTMEEILAVGRKKLGNTAYQQVFMQGKSLKLDAEIARLQSE